MSVAGELRKLFFKNWGLKALALLLASLTFHAIRGTISFDMRYDIPVVVEVDNERKIAILNQEPKTVEISVKGAKDDVNGLDRRKMKVVVKAVARDPRGQERVQISDRNIEGVSGVSIIDVQPRFIDVSFDHEIEKEMRVVMPQTAGKPLVGRVELEYAPQFVRVRGPKRRLTDREMVYTEPVDVEGRVETFEKKVKVLPLGEKAVTQIDPPEVLVTVRIVVDMLTRKIENIPVRGLFAPGMEKHVIFEPASASVTFTARKEYIETLRTNAVIVFADCSLMKDVVSGADAELVVHLNDAGQISSVIEPRRVKVRIVEPAAIEEGVEKEEGGMESQS